jgi:hypothetical protein
VRRLPDLSVNSVTRWKPPEEPLEMITCRPPMVSNTPGLLAFASNTQGEPGLHWCSFAPVARDRLTCDRHTRDWHESAAARSLDFPRLKKE